MLLKKSLTCMTLTATLIFGAGCGGHQTGVADATDEPEPELTEDEVAGEEEYMRSQQPE